MAWSSDCRRSKLNEIEKSVEIINEHEFDILDLNVGCPALKVVKKGKGAGLYKDTEHVARIIELMVKKSRFPVTAKIRIQNTTDPESTVLFCEENRRSRSAGFNCSWKASFGNLFRALSC